MTSHSVSIDAGNVKLSGCFLPATNGEPRALLVAVHGGTYTSKYFDTSPSFLLEFCASLGYSILALDRPGYGAATSVPFDQLSFDDQVPILRQALEEICHDYGQQSAGMFVIGHSIGGMISLLLAAENPHERLLGMNMTGSGALYREIHHDRANDDLHAEVQAAHAEEGMPMTYYCGRMGKFASSSAESKARLWRDVLQWEDYY